MSQVKKKNKKFKKLRIVYEYFLGTLIYLVEKTKDLGKKPKNFESKTSGNIVRHSYTNNIQMLKKDLLLNNIFGRWLAPSNDIEYDTCQLNIWGEIVEVAWISAALNKAR